jgi:hypothetical protein
MNKLGSKVNDEPVQGKINKIDTDGSGNIILQDVNGSTVTINYNDTDALKAILQELSDAQTFKLKELIGNQHKEILTEIKNLQFQSDEKNTMQKADSISNDLEGFFRKLAEMKIDSAKGRIIDNYKLLREYEELLILEDDPKRKMKYQREIEMIKEFIKTDEGELMNIAKTK